MYSRCDLPISSCTIEEISFFTRSTSSWRPTIARTRRDASLDVERLEDLLLVGDRCLRLRKIGGDEIGERARLTNVVEDAGGVARQVGHEAEHFARRFAEARAERVELDVAHERLGDALDLGAHIRLERREGLHPEAPEAVEHDRIIARPESDHLHHASDRPGGVELFERRFVDIGRALADDAYERSVRPSKSSTNRTLRGRPTLIGTTDIGNSTELRSGKIGTLSGSEIGGGREGGAPRDMRSP